MNRKLLALPLLALVSGQVCANEHQGWVYNGLTGWSSANDSGLSDTAFGSNSNIGYRWGTVGIEVGHTFFGTFKDSQVVSGVNVDVDSKVDGWNAGLNFNHDFDDKWSLQGRLGVFDWHDHGHVEVAGSRVHFSDSGNDWYAGLSIDRQWRKRSAIGFGYTWYKANNARIQLWGLHTEYRFGS